MAATSTNFSVHLERKAKQTLCPSCNNRSFTKYVLGSSGEHIADNVGKCNRLNNCGEHYTPKQFIKDGGIIGAPRHDYKATESAQITTARFIPNAGHKLTKSFNFELAAPESATYKAAEKYYTEKTGVRDFKAQGVQFLKSMVHIDTKFKTVFSSEKIGVAYIPSTLTETVKVKIITVDGSVKKQMFTLQNTSNYLFGVQNLPSDKKNYTLLICAGEDDTNAINANLQPFGFCAVTFGSESTNVPGDYLGYLRTEFKAVYCLFDNDKAGFEMAKRNKRNSNLDFFTLKNEKDVCDIFKKYGAKYLAGVLKNENQRLELIEREKSNLKLIEVSRLAAISKIKADRSPKVIVCELSFIEEIKAQIKGSVEFYTYSQTSRISASNANIYVFGSQNFTRANYLNTVCQIEKAAKTNNVTLFSDTKTFLNIAKSSTITERCTANAQIIISENGAASFIEIVRKHKTDEVLILETSESINKQLEPLGFKKIKRSELYAADKNKMLFVLYDSNVNLLPEAFSDFQNVVFVVNSEKKECKNMSDFCKQLDRNTKSTLSLLENDLPSHSAKMLCDAVKGNAAVRYNYDSKKYERCPNYELVLETENEIKTLCSDPNELINRISQYFNITTETELSEITTETNLIITEILETKKELAKEKKEEYFEFLREVEARKINSMPGLSAFVAQQEIMPRGAKIAYNRIKTLLKVNDDFSLCLEAVSSSYVGFTKTKGRFAASKELKNKSRLGTTLNIFKNTTDGNHYTKPELIEIARSVLSSDLIGKTEKSIWQALKKIAHLSDKRVRIKNVQSRIYEVIFIE